ncbi:SAM-dependent methyltransferase [Rheinheimera sp. UJ51]|uniref:class I SAM-dependent methyltransferase n=1 Tax=Rheinheimera sp. UJ51 TaxID=2892446 RepID=UPI001E4F9B0A|nr:SAM-dependent methyltransferase [Rheinheimera sp. UJ51]MCC5451657.1 SAM-dependent methyltransferase [Rheinheimera sp. UJ51]
MQEQANYQQFIEVLQHALRAEQLVKMVLSKYQGPEAALQRLEMTPVQLKAQWQLKCVYHYQTNHITKNLSPEQALSLIAGLVQNDFRQANLQTSTQQCQLSLSKKGKFLLSCQTQHTQTVSVASHNRQKQRYVEQSQPFLKALGVTDQQGQIIPALSNKWKQLNKFVEILAAAVKETGLSQRLQLRVADFGSGKAYLTFAMHDYFTHTLGLTVQVTGVELRQPLVDLCNNTAQTLGLNGLDFEQGDVKHFKARGINIMVALHACDTATDHALHMGIRTGAEIIMCSPCCHKEIRPQVRLPDVLAPMLQHGIHLGQEAEMLTDSLRALLLEAHGYQTKVFEFISLEHTSKNKMILATKRQSPEDNSAVLAKIAALKQFYGVEQHCLEQLLAASANTASC